MWVLLIFTLFAAGDVVGIEIRFTNIQCEVLDPSYCAYKKCELKVLGRGIIGVNVHALLLTGSFNNAKVNLSLFRKYNGYRPFMFNKTIDLCNFLSKNSEKKSNILTFEKIIFDMIAERSNVNHSCPYNHDIIFNKLVLKEEHFRYLPVPSGEYKLTISAASDKTWRSKVSVYVIVKEGLLQD